MSPVTGPTRGQEGSSLIETALASSVLLLLIFGIFQMSFALYSYHCICEVAREGSRYAIVRGSTSCTNTPTLTDCNASAAAIQTFVKSLNYPGINSQSMTVVSGWARVNGTLPATWSDCSPAVCNTPGNMVKVQVNYQLPLSIPFWRATTFTLTSTSQMVIAQ
ncbi:MAG TPA: TadE/TadG family type IV pilus assembly protein [Acidobacteriaceae bacterium]|jgi:Flp pilus assembly protein TadG